MKIVLWDTRRRDASKDFAGGYGVGQYSGEGGIRGQMVRWFYKRDHRPAALTFAYLASVFRKLGHTVDFGEERVVPGGDVYVFSPSLITLDLELEAMREIFKAEPSAKILVVGILATTLPAMFADLPVVLVQGDLAALVRAVRLSRATLRNIKQNLFWAFAYNFAGLPLAAGVLYPLTGWLLYPMFASVAMSISSITVVTNALRLRHAKL